MPEPAVTRITPAKESDAAIQNRWPSRSIPTRREMSAVKIGSVPKRSAAVVAVVRSSAKTKLSWFDEQEHDGERDERQVAARRSGASARAGT